MGGGPSSFTHSLYTLSTRSTLAPKRFFRNSGRIVYLPVRREERTAAPWPGQEARRAWARSLHHAVTARQLMGWPPPASDNEPPYARGWNFWWMARRRSWSTWV